MKISITMYYTVPYKNIYHKIEFLNNMYELFIYLNFYLYLIYW